MPHAARLLGFAFASADFLFETDASGKILFAAGASGDLVREGGEALVGRPAEQLFRPSDALKFAGFAKTLKAGVRAGPIRLTLVGGSDANLSMFRLPDNGGAISCTLARPGGPQAERPQIDPVSGLANREGFLAAAENAAPGDMLTLVDVPGLTDLCAGLSPENADRLLERIGASMQEAGASAAGRLTDSRFGALSAAGCGALDLTHAIARTICEDGLTPPDISETRVSLDGAGLTQGQRLLSLRYVIDRFAGGAAVPGEDIAASFGAMMDETQQRLAQMSQTVGVGDFRIAYQPIFDLASNTVAHYEALARFSGPEGTGETVKFIEALGIANALDLAVAGKVLALAETNEAHIAFNVSGETIASPASFGLLAGMLARHRKLAPRILIEVTETAAITDLDTAGKAIGALRDMGYRVGLDDFGAGAASLNYLHAFPIDFVKFDGAMICKIGKSKRDDALLEGLAKLCAEMGVSTIAEWIETRQMADQARLMGFKQGQGKYLGAPMLEIHPQPARPGKRQGLRESWG